MTTEITDATRFVVPDQILYREIDGEAILLNTETGLYFGLDDVGSVIWAGLREFGSIEAVLPRLLEHFEVEEATLREDLRAFTSELVENRLLGLADPE